MLLTFISEAAANDALDVFHMSELKEEKYIGTKDYGGF